MTTLRTVPEPSDALRLRVAAEVRAWRGRMGVTQAQLAQVLNVSQPSISAKLRGKTPFDLDEIERLAAFFGITPAHLLGSPHGGPVPPGDGDTRKSPRGKSQRVAAFRRKTRKPGIPVGMVPSIDAA